MERLKKKQIEEAIKNKPKTTLDKPLRETDLVPLGNLTTFNFPDALLARLVGREAERKRAVAAAKGTPPPAPPPPGAPPKKMTIGEQQEELAEIVAALRAAEHVRPLVGEGEQEDVAPFLQPDLILVLEPPAAAGAAAAASAAAPFAPVPRAPGLLANPNARDARRPALSVRYEPREFDDGLAQRLGADTLAVVLEADDVHGVDHGPDHREQLLLDGIGQRIRRLDVDPQLPQPPRQGRRCLPRVGRARDRRGDHRQAPAAGRVP